MRYLNNMQLTNRGLIVDFCLQDARKIFRRTQKLEKHQRLAMERKEAAKKERRTAKRAESRKPETVTTVVLGKRSANEAFSAPKSKPTVKDINDVEKLA